MDTSKNKDAIYATLEAISQPRNEKFRDIALYFFAHAHGDQWTLMSERGGPNSWWLYHKSGKWYRVRGRHMGKYVEVYAEQHHAIWNNLSDVVSWFRTIESQYRISQRKKAA